MGNSVLAFSALLCLSFILSGLMATAHFFPPPPMQVFILAGQSNMAGRGGTFGPKWDGYVPDECAADAKISRLNVNLTWELAFAPLHRDIDTRNKLFAVGIGPGMSFANYIKNSIRGAPIGLVPCAIGGTQILEWSRGTDTYTNMIKRATVAALQGEIKAVLWYQGENDTGDIAHVNSYKDRMTNLIQNIREDLNIPELPVIQVAIASGNLTYLNAIRAIQKGIEMPNVVCIDAMGLALLDDHLHLTTASQVTLGQMLGEAYINNSYAMKA